MNSAEILELLRKALADDDCEQAEQIVEEYADDWEGDDDLDITALESAVELGCTDYVEAHVEDFDLYELGYLHSLTTDPSMHETLADQGICRETEDFFGFRFAMESVNGTVLSFDPEFQQECWDRFREMHPCNDEDLLRILQMLEEEGLESVELEDEEYEIAQACTLLNVCEEDGEIVLKSFDDTMGEEYWDLPELIDSLGFDTHFEGDSWKMETNGVYYIE